MTSFSAIDSTITGIITKHSQPSTSWISHTQNNHTTPSMWTMQEFSRMLSPTPFKPGQDPYSTSSAIILPRVSLSHAPGSEPLTSPPSRPPQSLRSEVASAHATSARSTIRTDATIHTTDISAQDLATAQSQPTPPPQLVHKESPSNLISPKPLGLQSDDVAPAEVTFQKPVTRDNMAKVNAALASLLRAHIAQCQGISDIVVQSTDVNSLPTSHYLFSVTCDGQPVLTQDIQASLKAMGEARVNRLIQSEVKEGQENAGGGGQSGVPAIAGGAAGGVLLVVGIIAVVCYSYRRGKPRTKEEEKSVVFENQLYTNSRA